MTSDNTLHCISVASVSVRATHAAPANVSAELAKYESQLSDWVHCASSKTSEGKAKIAEITDKIKSIKAQVKRAADSKQPTPTQRPPEPSHNVAHRRLRLDQLGTWLDAQA